MEIEKVDFRLLVEAMVMTGSDLCASAKPWHLQLETVSVIYEEFYIQVHKQVFVLGALGKWGCHSFSPTYLIDVIVEGK